MLAAIATRPTTNKTPANTRATTEDLLLAGGRFCELLPPDCA